MNQPAADRKIIHVDMDAFYASVEQRDDPKLRGKPVAVGSGEARGVVAAASYEARKFGVRSAMASITAIRICPKLIFVKPRFEVYRAVSAQIREIFSEYTDLIEPLSLDEAYLDVTTNKKGMTVATEIAEEIRAKIRAKTGLTASAGVSYNKFLAKIASDQKKPNGLFVIPPQRGAAFVEALPLRKFHGVGPATLARMQELGMETGADLKRQSLAFLTAHFGKSGTHFHDVARGIDLRPVEAERIRKSYGAEETFQEDIRGLNDAKDAAAPLLARIWGHCEAENIRGRTLTVKIKYDDFRQITRSRSVPDPIGSEEEMTELCSGILSGEFPSKQGVRLIGVSLSSLEDPEARQQLAFDI